EAGSLKDSLAVGLQDFQPVVDVGRMVGARFQRYAKLVTKEGCAKFGNEFFAGVFVLLEGAGSEAVATALVAAPMGQLVQEGAVVGFGSRAGGGTVEDLARRHLDYVCCGGVVGVLASVTDFGFGC